MPIPENNQGEDRTEKPDIVEDVPAHFSRVEIDDR